MQISEITQYARALYHAHGDRAEYEATRRMNAADQSGRSKRAEDWRRIRMTIRELRGPRIN